MTIPEISQRLVILQQLRNEVAAISFVQPDKETFRTEIIAIADVLIGTDISVSFGRFLQDEFVEYVNFLIEWFYELRDSNAYRLNAEMAYCIEKLVERWNLQRQQRIIVFTVGTDFAIRKIKRNVISKQIDYLLTLQLKTGITFTKEPVFIFVPDQFKDDILSCVLLFHEVGHFVDRDNYIADFVFNDIMPKILANKTSKLRTDYFPRYLRADISKIPDATKVIYNHIEEYIADVFGTQYAQEYLMCYLSHLKAKNSNDDTTSHPSFNCRKRMNQSVLSYWQTGRTRDILLNTIISYIPGLARLDSTLTRVELLDPNLRFADEDQMFSAFVPAWRLVMQEVARNKIQRRNVATYMQICALPIFQALNNNLKSAISDFMRLHP